MCNFTSLSQDIVGREKEGQEAVHYIYAVFNHFHDTHTILVFVHEKKYFAGIVLDLTFLWENLDVIFCEKFRP